MYMDDVIGIYLSMIWDTELCMLRINLKIKPV